MKKVILFFFILIGIASKAYTLDERDYIYHQVPAVVQQYQSEYVVSYKIHRKNTLLYFLKHKHKSNNSQAIAYHYIVGKHIFLNKFIIIEKYKIRVVYQKGF